MAEHTTKKIKVFNIAKELNLSTDTIIEFLKKKGFEVRGMMTLLNDDMVHLLYSHFKKDKDVAERHQKKLTEFRTSRKKEAPSKVEKKPTTKSVVEKQKAEPAPVAPVSEVSAKHEIHPSAELPKAAVASEITTPVPAKVEAKENISIEPPIAPTETRIAKEGKSVTPVHEKRVEPAEKADIKEVKVEKKEPAKKKEAAKEKEKKEIKSPLELVTAKPQRGLKIMGKMDLEGETKAEVTKEPEVEEVKKKKKKKKKIKEEGKKLKGHDTYAEDEETKGKKRRRPRHDDIDQLEVEKAIRDTFAEMEEISSSARASLRKKKKKEREQEELLLQEQIEREKSILRVTEYVTVGELASLLRVSVAEVIQKCMGLGIMVSINQRLDKDTIVLVADEFGFKVEFEKEFAPDELVDFSDALEDLKQRPPVVTIMGHVDHGKTSLLDYIRNTNVVAGEAGGITQHIGAYEVTLSDGKKITFLDTPGHEAFTAMRARGAQVTDIVVLVVAADDSVMPQTTEAISHAQAANVPIIIAINKIDKAEANTERIRQQLADKGILVEEWGGRFQSVELSAKKGINIDKLLEKILLEAEILDLKANPSRRARGVIIESELDKGKGITATVLDQKGTLRIGDTFVCGVVSGRVRAMFDERGNRVEAAGPSSPVQVIGFDNIPQAGDILIVLEDERQARDISFQRQQLKREQDFRQRHILTLDDISQQIKEGAVKDLPVVVKGDVDGSVEALSDSLMKLSTAEVKVVVIHKGVGGISESDVLLAAASRAIIIGFHVRPNINARKLASQENIEIRLYSIIYNAINDVRSALEGMLTPTISEEILSTIEIRDVFKISKVGTIAGCRVQDGKIARSHKVRLIRDGIIVYDGTLASLKRFKDDVREVEEGYECGIGLEGFNDIKTGDIIESYTLVEAKRKL